MKTRLIRIGNSRGVRLAMPLLEQTGLDDEVEIRVEPGDLIVSAATSPRQGWDAAAAKHGPSALLDAPTATRFDGGDWTW